MSTLDVILKRFEEPDEIVQFEKGQFEIVRIGGLQIGRASYEPGWRWSRHIGWLSPPARRSYDFGLEGDRSLALRCGDVLSSRHLADAQTSGQFTSVDLVYLA